MPAPDPTDRDIYTPSRLNREARLLLERGLPSLWLQGELSNFSRPASGHWYFSLKDDTAQLRCAMFRQRNLLTQFAPQDGVQVLVRGRISLYEPRGDYQLLVEHMEEAGEGALRRRFEQLKAKLAAAGLFALERKRALPVLPRRVGVITSPTGAAVRDVLHILRRRFPAIPVLIYPVPVQGAQAAQQIAAAIALASARADCDVLILARGGGSLEDLWSFNEEIVARAMFECRVPIVTGIGHETDFTIADLVADVRAPTPSGAAELVAPDMHTWMRSLAQVQARLAQCAERTLRSLRDKTTWLVDRLRQLHPGIALRQQAQRVDELEARLQRAVAQRLSESQARLVTQTALLRRHSPELRLVDARGRLATLALRVTAAVRQSIGATRARSELAASTLNAFSPLATLGRGYSIVTDAHDRVLTSTERLTLGAPVRTRLAVGQFTAIVSAIEKTS